MKLRQVLTASFFALLMLFTLSGCTVYDRIMAHFNGSTSSSSQTDGDKPAVWCYRTLGKPECFSEPQRDSPDRLIAVDPPSLYPQTRSEYQKLQAPP